MARPPFEEPVLVARPPQEEGAAAKVVPIPKSVSPAVGLETPTSSSGAKGGVLAKLIVGIGFAAAMVGIGAFVGVMVIWMGRIELTRRIPPGGTPVEVPSSNQSGGGTSGPGTLPATLSSSVPGPDTPPKTFGSPSVGTNTPQIYDPDRSQILLEMELIRLDRSKAEQVLGQSDAVGLSPLARRFLEQWIWSATLAPGADHGRGTAFSSSGEVSSGVKPSSQGPNVSEKTPPGENRFSGSVQQENTAARPGSSLPKLPPGASSPRQGLEHSKLTPSFRERWGITVDRLMPSGGSQPGANGNSKPSQTPHSGSPSGDSGPPSDGHSKPSETRSSGLSPAASSGSQSSGSGRPGTENSSSGLVSLSFGQAGTGRASDPASPKAGSADAGGPEVRP